MLKSIFKRKQKRKIRKTDLSNVKNFLATLNKGRKRRMGFGKKGKNSFTIHRSEEVLPGELRGGLSRGSSASSDGEGSADGDRFAFAK